MPEPSLLDGMPARFCCKSQSTLNDCPFGISISTENRVFSNHVQRNCSMCRAVSSRVLVPGDVIVLLPGTTTCDMVLLQGNCLVEESSLSGEVGSSRNALSLHHVMSLTQRNTCWLCFAETTLQLCLEGTQFSHQALVLYLFLITVCGSSCALPVCSVQSDACVDLGSGCLVLHVQPCLPCLRLSQACTCLTIIVNTYSQ